MLKIIFLNKKYFLKNYFKKTITTLLLYSIYMQSYTQFLIWSYNLIKWDTNDPSPPCIFHFLAYMRAY